MGQINSADIDNTTGTINIIADKRCSAYDTPIVTNGVANISTQYLNINPELHERSYMGGISSKQIVNLQTVLCETQKVTINITYQLPMYENNSQIRKFHGIGHIILRNAKQCTSVQLCLDSVDISETGQTIATYVGYLEKDFYFSHTNHNYCNYFVLSETNIDLCVSFMITFTALPT